MISYLWVLMNISPMLTSSLRIWLFTVIVVFSCNGGDYRVSDKVYTSRNMPYTGVIRLEADGAKKSGNYTVLHVKKGIPIQIDYFENHDLLSTEIIKEINPESLFPMKNKSIKAFLVYEKYLTPAVYNKEPLMFRLVHFEVENIKDTAVIFENKNIILNSLIEKYNISEKRPYAWIGENFYGAYIFNDSFSFIANVFF